VSIAAIALEYGTTLQALAVVVGVDPTLFVRVDQRRQGLPSALLPNMALVLGTDVATVAVAAFRIDTTGNPRARTPLPPKLELGDTF